MPYVTSSFTGNGQSIIVDGVARLGISYHHEANADVLGNWFGLGPTNLVAENRTAVAGTAIIQNFPQGKVLDVVIYAVCNNAAAGWTALSVLNQLFDLVDGVQGSVSVTLNGNTRTLNDVERRAPTRATLDTQWTDASPSTVVWRYEVSLLSQNPQWS